MAVSAPHRDNTPVAAIRPIPRGEIAGIDDLVDFTGGQRAADARRRRRWKIVRRSVLAVFALARRLLRRQPRPGLRDRPQRPGRAVPAGRRHRRARRRSIRRPPVATARCPSRPRRHAVRERSRAADRRHRRQATRGSLHRGGVVGPVPRRPRRPCRGDRHGEQRTHDVGVAGGHRRPARPARPRPCRHRHRPVPRACAPA